MVAMILCTTTRILTNVYICVDQEFKKKLSGNSGLLFIHSDLLFGNLLCYVGLERLGIRTNTFIYVFKSKICCLSLLGML